MAGRIIDEMHLDAIAFTPTPAQSDALVTIRKSAKGIEEAEKESVRINNDTDESPDSPTQDINKADKGNNKESSEMDPKEIEKLQKSLAAAEADLKVFKSLNGVQKSHYDALKTDKDKEDFLAKSDADRQKIVDDIAKAKDKDKKEDKKDKMVYKSLAGDIFTEADDERLVKSVQRGDDLELEKSASEVFGDKTKIEKSTQSAFMRFVKSQDEKTGEALINFVKSATGLAKATGAMTGSELEKSMGDGEDVDDDAADNAIDALNKRAAAIAKSTGCSISAATIEAMNDPKAGAEDASAE